MNKTKLQLGLLENSFEINNDMNFNDLTDNEQDFSKLNLDLTNTSPIMNTQPTTKPLFDNLDDFDFSDDIKIKIFGIGGAGNNMVNFMANTTSIDKSWLYAINTDYQVLKRMPKGMNVILIGRKITKGLGSGSDPMVGQAAALEDIEIIKRALADTDLLFIASGMGKGTGTGASPTIAEVAKEMGIMTISLVNLPSVSNEGQAIYDKGNTGLQNLKKHTDGLLTISNEKLFNNTNGSITLCDSFTYANKVITNVIQQMVNTINVASEINVDFNDIKTFFSEKAEFQVNTFDFENDENVEKEITLKLNNEIYQDNIYGAKKIIISYHLNPCVSSQFMHKIRSALENITGNKDLEITFAVDYDINVKYANLTMIIATVNNTNTSHKKTIELEILNANFEHQSLTDTNIKSTTIELPNYEPKEHFHIENPFKSSEEEFKPIQNNLNQSQNINFDKTGMTPTKLNRLITKTLSGNFSRRLK